MRDNEACPSLQLAEFSFTGQLRHAENLNNPAAVAINRALWPSHLWLYYEQLMPRHLRQRYDPSSVEGNSTPAITIARREARLCLLIRQVLIPIFLVPP
ncbi:hypothetical protein AVEN_90162-1 [Araneus ventricosus]|uniref:Uncharacterized protein n=1 Tax=Araneus ventricosus TaxID=182803 RepID=A0A4Y2H893_ARAVE|nr:hypothetical protein AVEN_90162-1 [Araneus ventricosus]